MKEEDMKDYMRMKDYMNKKGRMMRKAGSMGFPFILTYIGAAIYFVQQSNGGFFEVLLALLQALVWPVYFVFHVLQLLGA